MSNTPLTQDEAARARLGIAVTQTAYALNNGGGIVPGQPLIYIDDQTTAGRPGYTPLNLSIPTGFVVTGVYQDRSPASTNTGADMFMAYNAMTHEVLIGIAGTNGVGNDMPDTRSDISYLGADQVRWLAQDKDFRKDLTGLGLRAGQMSDLKFIVGGDSLSAVPAILVPTALVYGIPGADGVPPMDGLSADQFSITNVVPLGARYAASRLGISSRMESFAEHAEIFNFTTFNSETGYDLVTGLGGGSPGRYFVGPPTDATYSSAVSRHQLNYSFANYVSGWGGDLTRATAIDTPPLFSHQSMAAVSSQIADLKLVENNWLSVSAAGYAGLLLSAPGESAASAARFLTSEWGWPSGLANTAGTAIEVISRGASYANPAYAVGALLAGFVGGKTMGSDAPVLPTFPPALPGYTRTVFQDPHGPFVGAVDRGPDQTILRYTDGSTRSYYENGTVALQRPDGTMMTRNAQGEGALRIGATGATTLIHAADVVDALPYSVTRIISSNADGLVVIKDYGRTGLTIQTGSFVNNEFVPRSTVESPFLDGAASVIADGNFGSLNSIAVASGISVPDLLAANPNLGANTSIVPGTIVRLPTVSAFDVSTITSPTSTGAPIPDATSAGPSALNNTLFSAPTYSTNPYGYSLFGSSLNNYAAANDRLFPADPLVLDLDGDGVKLTSYASAPVLFDADNDGGSLEQTGWVSAQDGIVVHDLNNDGKINSIAETLSEYYGGVAGSGGVAGTKPHANGFAALKSLDSNADNLFDSADAAWNNLRVWVDANHDGRTDAGELKTFADLN
ncbi:LysM peptidoglycan-binding domain-containing protein, partial [Variovorax sp. JS1663]|uniref:LysM peptidoglycan-binding domain-containing protein n=1 Tax=Variovorax sp. JS1663 TaxID=1851577 RepID=UPI001180B55C